MSRLLRSTTQNYDFEDEANVGIIYAVEKNVGKSITLLIIAMGQGILRKEHPLLLSGGDQTVCGTSLKAMLERISRTTMAVLVDDPKMTDQLAEFLLQVQGGYSQGSIKGTDVPRGTFLITSNLKETDRLKGRAIRIHYKKDENFHQDCHSKLHDELIPFVNDNEGLLIAWSIGLQRVWKNSLKESRKEITDALRAVLGEREDDRWYKGVSLMLYTYALIHRSAGLECDIAQVMRDFLCRHIQSENDVTLSVPRRLQQAIVSKINEDRNKILLWINPRTSVCRNGTFTSAFGIRSSFFDTCTNLTRKEIKKYCDESCLVNAFSAPISFASEPSDDLQHVIKRVPGHHKSGKGTKIPKDVLHPSVVELIEKVCGKDVEFESTFEESSDVQIDLDDIDSLDDMMNRIDENIEEWLNSVEVASPASQALYERSAAIEQELTPNTKNLFTSLTPRRKDVFIKGYEAGLITGEVRNEPQRLDTQISETPPESSHPAKKRLFPDETIGAMARTRSKDPTTAPSMVKGRPTKGRRGKEKSKRQKRIGVDLCASCRNAESQTEEWVQCDKCNLWYHIECVGLHESPSIEEPWLCKSCIDAECDED